MIVAFEGIDASGKATQVRMLKEYAEGKGVKVTCFDFPRYETDTGKRIKELLQLEHEDRNPLDLQALMTVNRYECQGTIEHAQARGDLVILDRYWLSGYVYGAGDGLSKDWLVRIHKNLIQPHQWFITDISIDESFRRRPDREDAYEASVDRLRNARANYIVIASQTPNARILNAMRSPEEIHQEILENLEM